LLDVVGKYLCVGVSAGVSAGDAAGDAADDAPGAGIIEVFKYKSMLYSPPSQY